MSSKQTSVKVSKDVKKYVRKQLAKNIEVKHHIMEGYQTSATNTGWVLPYPDQGITNADRIGDQILLKFLKLEYNVSALTTLTYSYRVVISMTKASALLTGATLMLGSGSNYNQGIPDSNYVRVLHDQIYNMSPADHYSATGRDMIKLNKKITFSDNSSTPGQDYIQVWVCCCDTAGISTASGVRFTGNFLLGYTDA